MKILYNMLVHGGRKKSIKNRPKRVMRMRMRMRGGHSPLPFSPADYNGLGTSTLNDPVNFAKMPNVFPSNQKGGSYGFQGGVTDVSKFGGSYAPWSKSCTGGSPDANSRGGNNFMSGGMRRRSKKTKKWWQRGCKGGTRSSRRSTKRSTRRSNKNNMRGGLVLL